MINAAGQLYRFHEEIEVGDEVVTYDPEHRRYLLGTVAAGEPIEAIEVRETVDVPRELVPRRGNAYVLRVRGDSMIDEQIRDGDLVVVEPREDPRDGETVVALIRGQDATLKKLQRRGRRVRLVPANPRLRPIEVPAVDVRIQGVVRALLRRY